MVTTVIGNNSYAVQEKVSKFIEAFRSKYGTSIERFDGAELSSADDVIDAVRSVSLLDPHKLVIVRDFSQSKELLDALPAILDSTADSTELLLYASSIDKRSVAYSLLKKNADFNELREPTESELVQWVTKQASELGTEITPVDARYLVELVGLNQQQLQHELEKLAMVSNRLTRETITTHVEPTPQSKIFSLLEALFSGDLQRTLRLYNDQRQQGEEPQKIIGMIIWQLEQLTLAVFAPTRTVDALTGAGMSPYNARKALELASSIRKTQLQRYVSELAEIDAQSKTSADIESALAVYFTSVSAGE